MEYSETWSCKISRKTIAHQQIISVAAGREKADLVLKNATFVNVFTGQLDHGDVAIAEGIIAGIGTYSGITQVDLSGKVLIPGFIDSHIHLESSLVSPGEFARAVIPHGTTTVITDPHEIANVMGTDGIDYMIAATEGLPLDVQFMIPACVPASSMDESGAVLSHRDIDSFFTHPRVLGLAEMMNFPGIIAADSGTVAKIATAQAHHKLVDGHAPGLSWQELNAYIASGIYSDHECATAEDALQKLRLGQWIMIREGTAARNLEALMPLIRSPQHFSRCMFCSDDKHPSDLLNKGHLDAICREAVRMGADPIQVVLASSCNAARCFGLRHLGAIAPGYQADLAVVNDLTDFSVTDVYKGGKPVFTGGQIISFPQPEIPQHLQQKTQDTFHLPRLTAEEFRCHTQKSVIGMVPGQITTICAGSAETVDLRQDILKIALVERHHNTGHIGIGYLKGYGLKSGAIATSVSHDSHNIICVGSNDADMALAVNAIAESKGGIVVAAAGVILSSLPLEIAGLMTERSLQETNALLEQAKTAAHSLGVHHSIDPFMTLSFMALPVIPELRLTTRGILDVNRQQFF